MRYRDLAIVSLCKIYNQKRVENFSFRYRKLGWPNYRHMWQKSAFDFCVQYYSASKNKIKDNFAPLKRYYLIFGFVLQYFILYFILFCISCFINFRILYTKLSEQGEEESIACGNISLGRKSKAWRRLVTSGPS